MSFEKILDKRGKTITLRSVTTTASDDFYQTVTETYIDAEIKAIVTKTTEGKDLLVEGYEVEGKVTAYISTDIDVSEGDMIIIDNTEYRIERITKTDAYKKLEAVPA